MRANRAKTSSSCSEFEQDPLEGLSWFVAAVEAGSFSAASRELNWPRASLSRRVAELEASLGVKLLHRNTRNFRLTRAGQEFFERAARIVKLAREARQSVRRADGIPRGLLRLTIPPNFGPVIYPLLRAFLDRYPEVSLEVSSSARLIDLQEDEFDLAVRGGGPDSPGLMNLELGRSDVFLVASPNYRDRYGMPQRVDDLSKHSCLLGRGIEHWPLREGGAVKVVGRLQSDDIELLLQATLAGQGICLLPQALTQRAREEGQLLPVLHDQIGRHSPLRLLGPSKSLVEPRAKAFAEMARAFWANQELHYPVASAKSNFAEH